MEDYLVRTIWLCCIDPFMWSVEVVTDSYFCLALPHCVCTMSRWHTDLCLGGLTWKEKAKEWDADSRGAYSTEPWDHLLVLCECVVCNCTQDIWGDECAWLRPDELCCRATEEQMWQITSIYVYMVGLQPFCVKKKEHNCCVLKSNFMKALPIYSLIEVWNRACSCECGVQWKQTASLHHFEWSDNVI